MTKPNKNILETANAEIKKANYEGFLAHCTEDTEWTFVGDQILKGKEAVRQYMAKAYIEPPTFTVEQLIAEGDFVTAIGEISMKNEAGEMIHYHYCDVWRFRDEKMAALQAFVIPK
ncbi:nuclear transport factor 2 family protein [Paracnuella aquatica]|uniref:nuclear transport factor 2 family protein n=1 Tax=Paracnuella aquatica TaxID=2268757 RepID=UPI000DEF2240|nr:nuclear transport factor 2 family protein [Paracnuella aquatica]RPD50670.1 nuclear transport factor 2 family protein [Paracnuella aquatica]